MKKKSFRPFVIPISVIIVLIAGCFVAYKVHSTRLTQTDSAVRPFLKIPELGIQIPLSADYLDLDYVVDTNNLPGYIDLSSKSLEATGGEDCQPSHAPLGILMVSATLANQIPDDSPLYFFGFRTKLSDGRTLYYQNPQFLCDTSVDTTFTGSPVPTDANPFQEFEDDLSAATVLK